MVGLGQLRGPTLCSWGIASGMVSWLIFLLILAAAGASVDFKYRHLVHSSHRVPLSRAGVCVAPGPAACKQLSILWAPLIACIALAGWWGLPSAARPSGPARAGSYTRCCRAGSCKWRGSCARAAEDSRGTSCPVKRSGPSSACSCPWEQDSSVKCCTQPSTPSQHWR